jgi:Holliday junction resolvase RusA-like endonuclease
MFICKIPGQPVPRGRPRMVLINGRPRAYTPKPSAVWEAIASTLMRSLYRGAPITDPVSVTITSVYKRPKRLMRKSDPDTRLWKPTRGDVDNECKAALDALVKAGILKDDALVVVLTGYSMYTGKTEEAHVRVEVHRVGPVP